MEDLVTRTRRDIREWKHIIALLDSGVMHEGKNGRDISADRILRLRQIIAENQILVDSFDPEGRLADGDFELGDVPSNLGSQLWKGRHVAFALDENGRAYDLRLYESASAAATDAGMTLGRMSGTIGAEGWSITPAAGTAN